ncbi:MAG TPA: hypothetical protein VF407_15935 [Polyangiaceae bacterium]
MPQLRSRSSISLLVGLGVASLFGCQAILGIDDTVFSPTSDAGPGADGPSDGGGNDATPNDAAPTASLLTFAPARIFLRRGETADVSVSLQRNGFGGAVTVKLAAVGDAGAATDGGGANGVSVAPISIAAGQTTGTLHLSADTNAIVGLTSLAFDVVTDTTSSATLPVLVAGAPGSPDTSFAVNGIRAGVGGGEAKALAIGPDDDIWATGNDGHWVVHHLLVDGTVDTSTDTAFAGRLSGIGGSAHAIAVRGSNVFVGGEDGSGYATIRKLTTAGVPDTTFGDSGSFQLVFGSGLHVMSDLCGLALAPNGDVLTAIHDYAHDQDSVLHLTAEGDKSNERDYGITVIPSAIVSDADGGVFVTGDFLSPDGGTTFFAQHLDPAFKDAGATTAGSPANGVKTTSLALSPDGTLVSAGLGEGHNQNPGAAYAAFDTTTMTTERVVFFQGGNGNENGFSGVAAERDAKVVYTHNGGGSMVVALIERYLPDGGEDRSFGDEGSYTVQQVAFGTATYFNAIALDSWGRIVVAGRDTTNGFYVTRLWP